MDNKHRDIIRSHYILLREELPTRQVIGFFLICGMFSMNDVQEILELPPSRRNSTILDLLVRKGPRAIFSLVASLEIAERRDLIFKLFPQTEDNNG